MIRSLSDTYSEHGAIKLAQAIRAYWQRRGKSPNVRIVKEHAIFSGVDRIAPLWVVRSDMINGRPR